ncbi:MAG: hypothetical protein Tsb0019_19090 [Roseibium sp.]
MIRQTVFSLVILLAASLSAGAADGSDIKILVSNAGSAGTQAMLSVAEIETAGLQEIEAYNPYEKRSDTYSGVWMQDFVARFGTGDVTALTTKAIDAYEIRFAREEWQTMRILIATRVNGEYIDFDRKGPMRIIFPDFDDTVEAFQDSLPKWTWMITEISME